MQPDSKQPIQLKTKNPLTRLYEQLYLQLFKGRLIFLILSFSAKLGLIILEEKTHISETKIRISIITTILILCFGLFSADLSTVHVFLSGDSSIQNTSQEVVETPSPNSVSKEDVLEAEVVVEVIVEEAITPRDHSQLVEKLNSYSTKNNLQIQIIPESREEQILLFEQYESYLQRNPGTPLLYLNASILAFSLNHDNLGTYYLDQAILLNPELKEITN